MQSRTFELVAENIDDDRLGRISVFSEVSTSRLFFYTALQSGNVNQFSEHKETWTERSSDKGGHLLDLYSCSIAEPSLSFELVIEYPPEDLFVLRKDLESDEMQNLMFSQILMALTSLPSAKSAFVDIRPDHIWYDSTLNRFVMVDHLQSPFSTFEREIQRVNKSQSVYIPPQMFESLNDEARFRSLESLKSYIYSLGLSLIAAIRGDEIIRQLYDFESLKFKRSEFDFLLHEIQIDKNLTPTLKAVIDFVLSKSDIKEVDLDSLGMFLLKIGIQSSDGKDGLKPKEGFLEPISELSAEQISQTFQTSVLEIEGSGGTSSKKLWQSSKKILPNDRSSLILEKPQMSFIRNSTEFSFDHGLDQLVSGIMMQKQKPSNPDLHKSKQPDSKSQEEQGEGRTSFHISSKKSLNQEEVPFTPIKDQTIVRPEINFDFDESINSSEQNNILNRFREDESFDRSILGRLSKQGFLDFTSQNSIKALEIDPASGKYSPRVSASLEALAKMIQCSGQAKVNEENKRKLSVVDEEAETFLKTGDESYLQRISEAGEVEKELGIDSMKENTSYKGISMKKNENFAFSSPKKIKEVEESPKESNSQREVTNKPERDEARRFSPQKFVSEKDCFASVRSIIDNSNTKSPSTNERDKSESNLKVSDKKISQQDLSLKNFLEKPNEFNIIVYSVDKNEAQTSCKDILQDQKTENEKKNSPLDPTPPPPPPENHSARYDPKEPENSTKNVDLIPKPKIKTEDNFSDCVGSQRNSDIFISSLKEATLCNPIANDQKVSLELSNPFYSGFDESYISEEKNPNFIEDPHSKNYNIEIKEEKSNSSSNIHSVSYSRNEDDHTHSENEDSKSVDEKSQSFDDQKDTEANKWQQFIYDNRETSSKVQIQHIQTEMDPKTTPTYQSAAKTPGVFFDSPRATPKRSYEHDPLISSNDRPNPGDKASIDRPKIKIEVFESQDQKKIDKISPETNSKLANPASEVETPKAFSITSSAYNSNSRDLHSPLKSSDRFIKDSRIIEKKIQDLRALSLLSKDIHRERIESIVSDDQKPELFQQRFPKVDEPIEDKEESLTSRKSTTESFLPIKPRSEKQILFQKRISVEKTSSDRFLAEMRPHPNESSNLSKGNQQICSNFQVFENEILENKNETDRGNLKSKNLDAGDSHNVVQPSNEPVKANRSNVPLSAEATLEEKLLLKNSLSGERIDAKDCKLKVDESNQVTPSKDQKNAMISTDQKKDLRKNSATEECDNLNEMPNVSEFGPKDVQSSLAQKSNIDEPKKKDKFCENITKCVLENEQEVAIQPAADAQFDHFEEIIEQKFCQSEQNPSLSGSLSVKKKQKGESPSKDSNQLSSRFSLTSNDAKLPITRNDNSDSLVSIPAKFRKPAELPKLVRSFTETSQGLPSTASGRSSSKMRIKLDDVHIVNEKLIIPVEEIRNDIFYKEFRNEDFPTRRYCDGETPHSPEALFRKNAQNLPFSSPKLIEITNNDFQIPITKLPSQRSADSHQPFIQKSNTILKANYYSLPHQRQNSAVIDPKNSIASSRPHSAQKKNVELSALKEIARSVSSAKSLPLNSSPVRLSGLLRSDSTFNQEGNRLYTSSMKDDFLRPSLTSLKANSMVALPQENQESQARFSENSKHSTRPANPQVLRVPRGIHEVTALNNPSITELACLPEKANQRTITSLKQQNLQGISNLQERSSVSNTYYFQMKPKEKRAIEILANKVSLTPHQDTCYPPQSNRVEAYLPLLPSSRIHQVEQKNSLPIRTRHGSPVKCFRLEKPWIEVLEEVREFSREKTSRSNKDTPRAFGNASLRS